MRDRLIELLKQKSCVYVPCDNECGGCKNVEMYDDSIADHLLANGVIVPPCKVGQKFYYIGYVAEKGEITDKLIVAEDIAKSVEILENEFIIYGENGMDYPMDNTYFTREEAEKHLQKGGTQ